MKTARLTASVLSLTLTLAGLSAVAHAGGGLVCGHCGGHRSAHAICEPAPTVRPVDVEQWAVADDILCLPHRRCLHVLLHGIGVECECAATDQTGWGFGAAWWGTAKSRPRSRLLRKSMLEYVPVVAWTSEPRCPNCFPIELPPFPEDPLQSIDVLAQPPGAGERAATAPAVEPDNDRLLEEILEREPAEIEFDDDLFDSLLDSLP